MAQWKETQEPYIKVQERIRTASLNPTAGEDLIIGVTLISDAGPSTPTLITSQSEFVKTYSANGEVTQEYINSLNKFYTGEGDSNLASTMWQNAYRLAGSNTMLVTRALKSEDTYFAKPLTSSNSNTYVMRDGELLKKIESGFKFSIDENGDNAESSPSSDGWLINVNGIGIFGNRTTDEGPLYDYYVDNLIDLVKQLNETSKFYSPNYVFYEDLSLDDDKVWIEGVSEKSPKSVVFNEVYLANNFLDKSDDRTKPESGDNKGYLYLLPAEIINTTENPDQKVIDLNSDAYSGGSEDYAEFYALNINNSTSPLKVRIRRFNHDAVTINSSVVNVKELTKEGLSQYNVIESVLKTYLKGGEEVTNPSILERDFFEVAIQDPMMSEYVSFFTVGNLPGRGDIASEELNDLLTMIQLELPEDLHDLGLNYYGYTGDDNKFYLLDKSEVEGSDGKISSDVKTASTLAELTAIKKNKSSDLKPGDIYKVGTETSYDYYKYGSNGITQIYADLSIDSSKTSIISVDDSDLTSALDKIVLDEVYITEGLSDLGNTNPAFQNYMATIAKNENYFYPVSTINSTNYMVIGNSASKISIDSYKLYMSAPWDIDTSSFGWKYYASPSVLYWEAVARNRSNNEEFRSVFGQGGGVVQYQNPVTEFNKKTRQLLLTKKVNTVVWNNQTSSWNMNDNYTKQIENTIMNDEANSRLMIRISKAIPVILKQFIGRKISDVLCNDVHNTINYFFKTTILPMIYTVDDYKIFCEYDEVLARQNKIKVRVAVRYSRSLKYIEVINDAFDVGMDISGEENI